MSSDTYFSHVHRDRTHRPTSSSTSYSLARNGSTSLHPPPRSVAPHSSHTSTFPPLYLDPHDPRFLDLQDGANGGLVLGSSGGMLLGSTYYHHPQLTRLVSHFLSDSAVHPSSAAWLGSAAGAAGAGADDQEADDPTTMGAGGAAGWDSVASIPQPRIANEYIALNEDLVPAPLDMDGDTLPSEQHASYPFGNLFGPADGGLAADSAIMGNSRAVNQLLSSSCWNASVGLSGLPGSCGDARLGGLDLVSGLGVSGSGRRGAVPSSWNESINRASRTKLVGTGGSLQEYGRDTSSSGNVEQDDEPTAGGDGSSRAPPPLYTTLGRHGTTSGAATKPSRRAQLLSSAQALNLSPFLLFRTSTSFVLSPPTWPFRRYGPGSTSYSALVRPSSNIHGDGPASAAAAASLGGLPASAKIIKEVWTDLAMEEIVPNHFGVTAGTRSLFSTKMVDETLPDEKGEMEGRKRKRPIDSDRVFAKRIGTLESDPLDRLGQVAREIRGQTVVPWGTCSSSSRRRRVRGGGGGSASFPSSSSSSTLSSSSSKVVRQEEEIERQNDTTFAQSDATRYGFSSLPTAKVILGGMGNFGQDYNTEGEQVTTIGERDEIGYETAQHIWIQEERDRVLPFLALRSDGVKRYTVKGLRGQNGVVSRDAWRWDRPMQEQEEEEQERQEEQMDRDAQEQRRRRVERNDLQEGQEEGTAYRQGSASDRDASEEDVEYDDE